MYRGGAATKDRARKSGPPSIATRVSAPPPGKMKDIAEELAAAEAVKQGIDLPQNTKVVLTSDRLAQQEAKALLGPLADLYGRIKLDDGRTVSARLLVRNFIRFAPIDDALSDDKVRQIATVMGVKQGGGRRRGQRGGGWAEFKQYIKAAALYAMYKNEGRDPRYFTEEVIIPIFGTSKRVLDIIIKLADQVVVKTPVTALVSSLAAIGFTANVAANITGKLNTWARGVAAAALTDEVAESAAQVAVGDFKSIVRTTGIGIVVVNQLGFLPFSSLAAAILYSLKITATNSTVRANAVAMLYTWYLAMPDATRDRFNQKVTEYAEQAKQAAASGAAAAVPVAKELGEMLVEKVQANPAAFAAAATAAAGAAGVALTPGAVDAIVASITAGLSKVSAAGAGINAFQAIAATATTAIGAVTAAPLLAADVPKNDAEELAGQVLAEAAPAAAIAAADAGAFGAELEAAVNAQMAAEGAAGMGAAAAAIEGAMPEGGRKRRKTKKRAMRKRRMTRRRPIFSY